MHTHKLQHKIIYYYYVNTILKSVQIFDCWDCPKFQKVIKWKLSHPGLLLRLTLTCASTKCLNNKKICAPKYKVSYYLQKMYCSHKLHHFCLFALQYTFSVDQEHFPATCIYIKRLEVFKAFNIDSQNM